jgi:trimeric autotransporter adhesin
MMGGVDPPIGGGGSCNGRLNSSGFSVANQLPANDALYTCSGSAWVPEALIVGSVDQSGAAPTCTSSANAGMLEYTGGAFQYCNGSSWITLSGTDPGSGTIGGTSGVLVELTEGSASAPSLTFYADTATGIYQPSSASHNIAITTNGTEAVLVDSSGNLTLEESAGKVNVQTGAGYQIGGTTILALPSADTTSSIAIGKSALAADTTGNSGGADNTAVGYDALTSATTATTNTAVGYAAGEYITTASYNVAIGYEAMQGVSATPLTSAGTGQNTAVGDWALLNIQGAATQDTALGAGALYSNTTGYANTALGTYALYYSTTSAQNTAVGMEAMGGVSATPLTGSGNTAVGDSALYLIQSGANTNTAVGDVAGEYITTGSANTAIGTSAMQGVSATPLSSGYDNTAVGHYALNTAQAAVWGNTAVGSYALENNTTGVNSTALGYAALAFDTTGTNSALGFDAGAYISTGASNTAIGTNAMQGVSATLLTGSVADHHQLKG